jgi:Protein of unknown function (DUF3309)
LFLNFRSADAILLTRRTKTAGIAVQEEPMVARSIFLIAFFIATKKTQHGFRKRRVALALGHTAANDSSVGSVLALLGATKMSIGTIILIILIIALLGGFSGLGGGPFYGTGYYGGGGLGLVVIILLILLLMGRI